jgi:hypothetical protein
MKTWLAPWIMAIFGRRSTAYLALAWVVSGTLLAAYCLWAGEIGTDDLSEIGVRTIGLFVVSMGAAVWIAYVASLIDQLSPAAVQLVPRLRKSTIGVTIGFWLFMSSALATEFCLLGGRFWPMASLTAAVLAFAVTRASLGGLPIIVAIFIPMVAVWSPRIGLALSSSTATTWKDVALLAFTIAAGTGWIMLQLSGRAETRLGPYERMREARRATRDPRLRAPWALAKSPILFARVFDRVLRIPSPAARALHGMSPGFHWSEAVLGTLKFACSGAVGACFLAVILFPETSSTSFGLFNVLSQVSVISFCMCPFLAGRLLRELGSRQREQALLVMLPGVPNGQAANAWIMRALLVQHAIAFGVAIVIVGAVLLGVFLALGMGLSVTLRMIAGGPAVALLATPVLFQDYATMRASIRFWLLVLVPPFFVLQLLLYKDKVHAAMVIVWALLFAAIVGGTRYLLFRTAPSAFPVGRLAK